jgi:FixJ family two-component response regulator
MTSLATTLLIGFVVTLTAVLIWLVRREAKARSRHRRRAAIIANIREQTERESAIIGWVIRDDPAQAKIAAQNSRLSPGRKLMNAQPRPH